MKLIFDGEAPAYHPATGLLLTPGEADYPEDRVEQLIAAGLREPDAILAPSVYETGAEFAEAVETAKPRKGKAALKEGKPE